ncbi:MAG: molecular chaperone Hsp33 [Alphaproteobacteria bacterium]|nr:MAG: molecular chaperone Hsp33 [Alphaproteobacteria bacterium]
MSADNFFQIFQLEASNIRGRIIRMGSVLDDILEAHDYPLPIAHLVAETITLTLALSSMLKYEGVFTLQVQGDGPLKMLVSDVTSEGIVRACASFDTERFQNSREQIAALKTTESSQNHLAQYLGKGHIAFTVDQGKHTERYQGIVELKGASMVDCVQHYFVQSEQIGTGIKMAVGKRDGKWRAGAIMLQHMPEDEANMQAGAGNLDEDDWRRAMILLDSCTDDEFLTVSLDADQLLMRLFHEEGVRVYEPQDIKKGCRCYSQRVENILYSMSEDDINHMSIKGNIEMTCEFCSRIYTFDTKDILRKIEK